MNPNLSSIVWISGWAAGLLGAFYYGRKLYLVAKAHKKLKLRSWQKINLVTGKGRNIIQLPTGAGRSGFIAAEEVRRSFHARGTEILNQIDNIKHPNDYISAMAAIKVFQNKYREVLPWLEVQSEVTPLINKLEEKEDIILEPLSRHYNGKESNKVWLL